MFPMLVLAAALLRGPSVLPTLPVTATVPAWEWVDIKNPEMDPGQACGMVFGNEVELIGRAGTKVLVRYHGSPTAGTPCDGGEIFFLSISSYRTMTARYKAEVDRRAQQAAEVEKLLLHPVHNPREQTVPEWMWVDVLNGDGGVFGDTCGIQVGATVSEIAPASGNRVLARYYGSPTAGTPCDGGEIFFVNESYFGTATNRFDEAKRQAEEEANLINRLLLNEPFQRLKRVFTR